MIARTCQPDGGFRARARQVASALGVLWTLSLTGCFYPELETSYGVQKSPTSSLSVNGVDTLAQMFRQVGHEVVFKRVIMTPSMDSVDTIVWFPDDFGAPKSEVCEWFDEWLSERSGRTLVYVGRDYDAAPQYWKAVVPLAPRAEQQRYRQMQEMAEALSKLRDSFTSKDRSNECEWFKIEHEKLSPVDTLSGRWGRPIDATKAQVMIGAKLIPSISADELLAGDDEPLVMRLQEPHWGNSRLIAVANGSFLLNFPLANYENRKLAGELISSIGSPGRVVFLSSRPGGPPIDPSGESSLWQVFGAWPLNAILLHFAVLGIIFCFARWPIFGRPQTPPTPSNSDFGKHVDAVGQLLRRTKDREYARGKLPPETQQMLADRTASSASAASSTVPHPLDR